MSTTFQISFILLFRTFCLSFQCICLPAFGLKSFGLKTGSGILLPSIFCVWSCPFLLGSEVQRSVVLVFIQERFPLEARLLLNSWGGV